MNDDEVATLQQFDTAIEDNDDPDDDGALENPKFGSSDYIVLHAVLYIHPDDLAIKLLCAFRLPAQRADGVRTKRPKITTRRIFKDGTSDLTKAEEKMYASELRAAKVQECKYWLEQQRF